MNSEKKICQNCKQNFVIEPDDFAFYEKIQVPPPTWCPECRLIRRMAVCNERTLYKRKCSLCGHETISMYPQDTPFPVYCIECWRSDKWDVTAYGQKYDFSKPFFEQFRELREKVPRVALLQQGNMVRSEYTNRSSNNKDCYLVFRSNYNENCLYSHSINDSKDCIDSLFAQKCELAYECVDCFNCYDIQYCQECKNCSNSAFLYDCRDCQNCVGCSGLRHKQYCIFNKQYSKEEYLERLKEFNMGNIDFLEGFRARFEKFISRFIRQYLMSTNSIRVSGNWLDECKNILNSYACRKVEDGKNLFGIIEAKDSQDYFYWGRGSELIYETSNCGYNCSRVYFSDLVHTNCANLQYCDTCISSTDSFGCISLHKKQYCILNKQYTEKEYKELVPKIIEHINSMPYSDKKGRTYKYGEFFPTEIAVFAYNETVAQDYFPLTKEAAEQQHYRWKELEKKDYPVTKIPDQLPSSIKDADNSILKEVIGCEHEGKCSEKCTTAFKIIEPELHFYRRMNLPFPRLCPNCRHYQRLKQRNPLKLWHRECMCDYQIYQNTTKHHHHSEGQCPNEFETSYAPDRPEIVYCEQCYNAEVV